MFFEKPRVKAQGKNNTLRTLSECLKAEIAIAGSVEPDQISICEGNKRAYIST